MKKKEPKYVGKYRNEIVIPKPPKMSKRKDIIIEVVVKGICIIVFCLIVFGSLGLLRMFGEAMQQVHRVY